VNDATPRRFIAGAVCPRCGAQDRIRVFEEAGQRLRECVACDFRDELEGPPAAGPAGDIPGGKHDRPRPSRPADGAQPLRFFPAKSAKKAPAGEFRPASDDRRQPSSPPGGGEAED